MSDTREGYEQIGPLLASIAEAMGLSVEEAARGVEDGSIALTMGETEDGARFVEAARGGHRVRIGAGRIWLPREEAGPGGGRPGG